MGVQTPERQKRQSDLRRIGFGRCRSGKNSYARIHTRGLRPMHMTYYDEDDILVLHLSDKPISREVSQDWNTHISYAEDGTAVEIVIIDAAAIGAFPLEVLHAQAA